MVVGVVMSKTGLPLAHEVFAGNKNEVTCFKEMIETLMVKYGIKKDRKISWRLNVGTNKLGLVGTF